MSLTLLSQNKQFAGWHRRYRHHSVATKCEMDFAVYIPPQVEQGQAVPVLYWLSGLTCNDENVMQKSGIQAVAAELGIMIVAPDTSPRGGDVANDPSYDLGQGAGFYVNATEAPWAEHYQMYDYVVDELPALIKRNFSITGKQSICGHSMGGHGALMIALKNSDAYQSVSAFSPIVNPVNCEWGKKAFKAYLGGDEQVWKDYDACLLLEKKTIRLLPILIDQGTDDQFYPKQLLTERFIDTAKRVNYPVTVNLQADYDHSYFFISSFIKSHLQFHKAYLS